MSDLKKLDILIVEDDPEQAGALQFLIEGDGRYSVEWTESGQEAIQHTSPGSLPAFVISDVNLEEDRMGFDVAAHFTHLGVPVLIVTGRDTIDSDKSSSARHGAVRYMHKPYDPAELLDTMANMLSIMGKFEKIYKIGDGIEFDADNGILTVHGAGITMGDIVSKMLKVFLDAENKPVPLSKLAVDIYGSNDEFSRRAALSAIRRLRKKLAEVSVPFKISNSIGRGSPGYRLINEEVSGDK
ncbi:response regulator [bacterium]|nr:response regulator [bacterium]